MHRPVPEVDPELGPVDEDGFPREGPLSYDQADLALVLGSSLRHHRDQARLDWHLELNERVDFLDAQGQKRWVFPDLYVVVGLRQQHRRGPLRTWVVRRHPNVAFEFATAGSLAEDRGEKREKYRALGVDEYFLFDVDGVDIPGQLQAWRLDEGGEYQPIPRLASGRFHSRPLDLELAVVPERLAPGGAALRAFCPGTVSPLPTEREAEGLRVLQEKDAALQESGAALQEKDAALDAARARIEALEAALRKQGGAEPT
ncbi:MAG: Uma2 family endonuclease [Planctomycetes bacterium]|nr:Uma2 family endonuclease [Planctomycetota bacterium]